MKLTVDTDELLEKLNDSIGATMGEQIPRWLWEGVVAEFKNEKPQGRADMKNITETPSSCITTNPNSVEAYHQSLKEGVE